ncbi:SDR family oxidoreductase [Streptomyces sp. MMS24-I2-30]|uniref:SDR family oxidoreductase n=1 Tax=Streptomyces sp. MMS24-I2-30 TaxID=3351564 RepID=UPI003896AF86
MGGEVAPDVARVGEGESVLQDVVVGVEGERAGRGPPLAERHLAGAGAGGGLGEGHAVHAVGEQHVACRGQGGSADVLGAAAATARFEGAVVVNTAGIMVLAPLAEMDLDAFDRILRVNVRGTFVVSQLAARRLRRGGALISISTSVTRLQQPAYGAYAATNGAVEAMTLILARELRGRDITVNAVVPGPTATPRFLEGKSEQLIDRLATASPLERLGTPDDIAHSVAFLAGATGRWVNGQVLFANGGIA